MHGQNHIKNVKMVLKDVGRKVLDFPDLVQDTESRRTLVNAVMKFRLP